MWKLHILVYFSVNILEIHKKQKDKYIWQVHFKNSYMVCLIWIDVCWFVGSAIGLIVCATYNNACVDNCIPVWQLGKGESMIMCGVCRSVDPGWVNDWPSAGYQRPRYGRWNCRLTWGGSTGPHPTRAGFKARVSIRGHTDTWWSIPTMFQTLIPGKMLFVKVSTNTNNICIENEWNKSLTHICACTKYNINFQGKHFQFKLNVFYSFLRLGFLLRLALRAKIIAGMCGTFSI